MAAATKRQSDAEIYPYVQEPKSRHVVNMVTYKHTLFTSIRNNRTTSHRKITTYRLSPVMNTWTPAATVNKQPASAGTLGEKGRCRPSARDTGGKGTLPAQCTGFDTLDNCGHKTPTQSKRKRTGKKRLKGHGPDHVYNTLGYIHIVLLSPFVGGGWDPDGWGPPGCPTHFFSPDIS